MLPNLKSLTKLRQAAVTPNIMSRGHQAKTDQQEVDQLRFQVESLQRQLESVQSNKSFIVKISNQQCTQCQKLKLQLQQLQKNEAQLRREYQSKIESLNKSQLKSQQFLKQEQTSEKSKYEELLAQLQALQNSELFFSTPPSKLALQPVDSVLPSEQMREIRQDIEDLEQKLGSYESQIVALQKDKKQLQGAVSDLKFQLMKEQAQHEAVKNQHKGCVDQIYGLQLKLELSNKPQKNLDLPNDILQLKKTIDKTIEKNMVHQLMLHNEDLKDKLISQNAIVSRRAQENQIERHLIKIETLESELYLSLRCCRCHELLSKPHTYIPCGHSCCEKCLKPSCEKCTGTEILYRNLQFDELIKIYYIIKDTKNFIKGCLLSC